VAKRPIPIPNQHGAWSMLVVPFVFGMAAAGPQWVHAPLFAAWLAAYFFSYAFLQWIRTRNSDMYVRPAILYAIALACFGGAAAFAAPRLLLYAPLFLPMLLVNMYYASRNRERALMNDFAAVIQFSLIVFVAYAAGGGRDPWFAAELFALSVLYYAGTVFYVKTMIREKRNRRFYFLSVGYHMALLAVSAALFPPLMLAPFAVLLVRAAWTPRANLSIKQAGMLEFAYSAMMVIAFLMAY